MAQIGFNLYSYMLKDGYWIKVAPKMPFFLSLSINEKKRTNVQL